MADNTTLDAGSGGDTIATDDIGGVKYPRTKLVIGADGANDGDVSAANPLPAKVTGAAAEDAAASGNPLLIGGRYDATPRTLDDGDAGAIALDAAGGVIIASMSTLLGHVDGVEALLTTIDADTGSMAANLTTIAGAVSGTEFQVDIVSSALPTGAATAANQSTIIGHVDGIEALLTTIDADTSSIAGDLSTLAGAVSGTEFQVDVLSSALPSGAATSANQTTIIGHLDGVEGLLTTMDADTGSMASDLTTLAGAVSGTEVQVDVVAALPAGTNNIGDVDIATIQAATSGGASVFRSLDLDESEEEVKATAGQLYGGIVMNLASSKRYLKFYNATAANVTVGTTTPVLTIPIPTSGDTNGAGFLLPFPAQGVAFDTAITVAATTGLADNDTGAPGANEVVVNLFYK